MTTVNKRQVVFAAISPHPPIILPSVGEKEERKKARKTIASLEYLGKKLKEAKPDLIVIASPHPDWGFNVPLFFLAEGFKGEIKSCLIGGQSPQSYFNQGGKISRELLAQGSKRIALIASADLSHVLKEEGPYGFHPQGPQFDRDLIEALKKKDLEAILKLDDAYPDSAACGLRSICFVLGMLEESKINWQPEILSYECPWGVGYLVVNFKL